MTKKDILRFLEQKKDEKLSAIVDEYHMLRQEILERTCVEIGLTALADKMQPFLAEAHCLFEAWTKEQEGLKYISIPDNYFSLCSRLGRYTSSEGAALKCLITEDVMLDPEEAKCAYKEYQRRRNGVYDTFRTVITTVQEMRNAKQAAIYLKELGFDLTELEKPAEEAQTALMVPVDTRFLFVEAA